MAETKERGRGVGERKLCLTDSHLGGLKKTSRRSGTDFIFATKTMHVFLFSSYMLHAVPILFSLFDSPYVTR